MEQRGMSDPLLDRLRNTACNHAPYTPEHKDCICRLANEAADEIEALRALLKRIDDVTTWKTTPLGSRFQEEVEAALSIAERE
jgi:hypothetical protein